MKAEDAKKIIATAIDREVEAYTFYRTVSDRVKDPALKSLFDELAGEEKKHRVFLEGFLAKDVGTMKWILTPAGTAETSAFFGTRIAYSCRSRVPSAARFFAPRSPGKTEGAARAYVTRMVTTSRWPPFCRSSVTIVSYPFPAGTDEDFHPSYPE